jgi:hypothetical protein
MHGCLRGALCQSLPRHQVCVTVHRQTPPGVCQTICWIDRHYSPTSRQSAESASEAILITVQRRICAVRPDQTWMYSPRGPGVFLILTGRYAGRNHALMHQMTPHIVARTSNPTYARREYLTADEGGGVTPYCDIVRGLVDCEATRLVRAVFIRYGPDIRTILRSR